MALIGIAPESVSFSGCSQSTGFGVVGSSEKPLVKRLIAQLLSDYEVVWPSKCVIFEANDGPYTQESVVTPW